MTPFPTKPNIDEVARLAGVNRSTVSKAFSTEGRYLVSPKTKELVFKVAREIGYEPSVAARRMIARRSRVIALLEQENWSLLNSVNDPSLLAADRFSGAHDITYAAGYDLLPLTVKSHSDKQNLLLRMYLGQHFDGILCISPRLTSPDFFKPLLDQGCVVATDGNFAKHPNLIIEASWLSALSFQQLIVPYLAAQGRKHLAWISPPDALEPISGIQVTSHDANAFSGENILRAVTQLMTDHPQTDAIAVADDLRGWGIYQALKALGYRVPEQITIAGVSDFRQPLKPLPIHFLVQAPLAFTARRMTRQLIAQLEPGRLAQVDEMHFPAACQPEILENAADDFRVLAAHAEKLERIRAAQKNSQP